MVCIPVLRGILSRFRTTSSGAGGGGRRERAGPRWYNRVAYQAGCSRSVELRGPLVRIRGFPLLLSWFSAEFELYAEAPER